MTRSLRLTTSNGKRPSLDYGLIAIIATLLVIGLIMVFSASYQQAVDRFDVPATFFVQKQLQWIVVGIVAMIVMSLLNYRVLERVAVPLLAIVLVLLIAVLIFGQRLFGSTRSFFDGSVQPSEMAKLVMIIYAAAWLSSKGQKIKLMWYGLAPFGVLLGIVAGLIVIEPNLSTAILIVATAITMFFMAGATFKQVLLCGVIVIITFAVLITQSGYGRDRWQQLADSVGNPAQAENEQIRAIGEALTGGGPLGRGIGGGTTKERIPLLWSDGIISVIGEELGLPGTLLVIALFLALVFRGFRIAIRAPDDFGFLLAFGVTIWLVYQAVIHLAVATALAPPTGIPLPFISYGGSALVSSLAAVGVLMSVARSYGRGAAQNARFDFGRWNGGARLSSTSRGASPAGTRRRSSPVVRRSTTNRARVLPRSGGRPVASGRRSSSRRPATSSRRTPGRRQ